MTRQGIPHQRIRPAASGDWPAIVALLRAGGLPVSDLAPEHASRFLVARGESVVGCVAVEPYGDHGLLRSLAVAPEAQGMGLGGALVDAAVEQARASGVHRLVLLTATAEAFFRARGWAATERSALPLAVRGSSEFAGACCAGAVCLWRDVPRAESEAPQAQGEAE